MSNKTVDRELLVDPVGDVSSEATAVLHAERVPMRIMIGYQVPWQDLCDRALERNVFFEPAFALPLIQHVVTTKRPEFLLVWEEDGPTSFSRLIGMLPILPPDIWMPGTARGFIDAQIRLGTPVLDRDRAAVAFEAMLAWIHDAMPKVAALRLSGIDATGPFFEMLSVFCAATDRPLRLFGKHRRATLQRAADGKAKIMPFVAPKRRKELNRQHRRLSEKGERTYTSASTPDEVARAAERFLALEHNGWKGERGTALLARPRLTTFTRSMTRLMAHEGKCRIDAIEIDGIPVAMGIILTVGDRAHFWKTAFHEAFKPLSPGVQFALELTERQLADPTVLLTDSCAIPNHPMIDRLWHDRMKVTDLLVAITMDMPRSFARARQSETAWRAVRTRVKGLYNGLRRLLRRR